MTNAAIERRMVIGAWSLVIGRTRAGDGTRTHDSHLGKVALYQLSYTRKPAVKYRRFAKSCKAGVQNAVLA